MTNRTVGYVRVSTEEQATEGVSLAAQEERIRAYCALHGFDLVEIVADEGVSAGKPLFVREGGRRLVDLLSSTDVRHVVALKLDRLFRDAIDCLSVVQEWERRGFALHLLDQGGQAVNTQSAMGRFFLTVLAGIAEMERNLIKERTRTALQFKRRNGKVYGPTPYGWRREGDRLLPVPEELHAQSMMREYRGYGLSYRAIAQLLEEQGVATKQGGRWEAMTVKKILDREEVGCGA